MSLAAYLPQDRRLALAHGENLPAHTHGTVLFADIAGFTPLTEALDRALGARRGAEELAQQINHVYEALIAQVEQCGGSVIGFAGDSITCWFDQPGLRTEDRGLREAQPTQSSVLSTQPSAAQQAVACALALQQAMQQFAAIVLPGGTTTALALKVAVASGPARRLGLGDPAMQLIDVLAGAPLSRAAIGEHLARPGEALIDEATAATLGDAIGVSEWRADAESGARFAVLAGLQIADCGLQIDSVDNQSTIDNLQSAIVRPWLLPAVYERYQAGLGEFLTELRPAVPLFLRFDGLDYDGDLDAGAKLDAFIRRVQQILARYEATLLQLTIGDKGSYLYAVFGAPIAHEDDARRAASAALELRALSGELPFLQPLQIGISRGVLRAGACGSVSRRAYALQGDEVNLAARLMQRAMPGEILISGRLQAALVADFALEPLAPITLKGMPEPLPLFRLAGERPRSIRLEEPTYALPMVGRTDELARIGETLDRALQGRGQVVGIIAEAGMGKSRLVAETIRLARRRGLRAFGGACQSSGTNTPYLVWEPIWRAVFDLDPGMPLRRQLRALHQAVEDWAPARLEALPLLGPLLDLNLEENDFAKHLEPQFRKSALHALLLDCLAAAAREARDEGSGLLLVLEDLHWIDALSHELLEQIAQTIVDLPVLIVLAYRPPELLRLHAPRIEALGHFTRVELAPLTDAEAAQAIRAKLAQLLPERKGAATPALIARITAKAQGNPFYVEELLNYLRDCGLDPRDDAAIDALDLPSSLHTLILSRIDQLSARQQAELKVASVIGRLFRFADLHGAYPILGAPEPLRADLDELAKLELTPLDTPEPELTYLFKHVVTQEVAYESLTAQARASLHEQLAAFLERLADDDSERYLDLLAFHYERSDNLPKKRAYLRRAGEAAAARFANDAAVNYVSRALELAPTDDLAERFALLLAREHVHDVQNMRNTQAADLAALEELAEALNDDTRRAVIAARRVDYVYWLQDFPGASAAAPRAVALAEAAAMPALAVEVYCRWIWALVEHGDAAAARPVATACLDLARAAGDQTSAANALYALADLSRAEGDYMAARTYHEQALHTFRDRGDRRGEARALGNLGQDAAVALEDHTIVRSYYQQSLHLFQTIGDRWGEAWMLGDLATLALDQGDRVGAQSYLEQSLHISRATGNRLGARVTNTFGWAMQCAGDYAAARAYFEQSVAIVRATSNHYGASFSYNNLGTVARNQGNLSDARSWYQQALGTARTANHQQQEGVALWGLGNVALDSGELDRAEEMYRAAVAVFEAVGHEARVIEAVAGLAAVALARHDLAQAQTHVETILEYLAHTTLTTNTTEEPFRVELICYQVLHTLGDSRAEGILESAYQRLQDRAARITDARLRRSFLENVPHHREIVAAWAAAQS